VSVGGAMIGGVNNYTYRAEWSYEACEYVAAVAREADPVAS
jgi:hypothetical protein